MDDEMYSKLVAFMEELFNRQIDLHGLVVSSRTFPDRPYMLGTPAYEKGTEILPERILTDFGPVTVQETPSGL